MCWPIFSFFSFLWKWFQARYRRCFPFPRSMKSRRRRMEEVMEYGFASGTPEREEAFESFFFLKKNNNWNFISVFFFFFFFFRLLFLPLPQLWGVSVQWQGAHWGHWQVAGDHFLYQQPQGSGENLVVSLDHFAEELTMPFSFSAGNSHRPDAEIRIYWKERQDQVVTSAAGVIWRWAALLSDWRKGLGCLPAEPDPANTDERGPLGENWTAAHHSPEEVWV